MWTATVGFRDFHSAGTDKRLLKSPPLEAHCVCWFAAHTLRVGSLVFPVVGCTTRGQSDSDAHTRGISFQLGLYSCYLCLIPALGVRRPGLCLQRLSGAKRLYIFYAKPSWWVHMSQLRITRVLTVDFLPAFHHFECLYLLSQNPLRFLLPILSLHFFLIISFRSWTLLVLNTVIMMIALSSVMEKSQWSAFSLYFVSKLAKYMSGNHSVLNHLCNYKV